MNSLGTRHSMVCTEVRIIVSDRSSATKFHNTVILIVVRATVTEHHACNVIIIL